LVAEISDMPLVFPEPPLSTAVAHLLTFFFSFAYLASIYLSKNARLSFSPNPVPPSRFDHPRLREPNERWRDDPDVIKARLFAASVATALCAASFIGLVWRLVESGQNVRFFPYIFRADG
jgi:prenyl protein peptidase